MKRKLLAGLLAAVLAITTIPFMGNNTLYAQAEEVTEEYVMEATMKNQDGREEISVGDELLPTAVLYDANGEGVPVDDWEFISESIFEQIGYSVQFYSENKSKIYSDTDSDRIAFSGTVPEEAFGKYAYYLTGGYLISDEDKLGIDLAVSEYPVTSYCGTKHTTFMKKGDNATVFTIFNSDSSFKLTIPSSVKANGKSYKVTEIGEYALENDKGTKGLTSVTIPSTVKKIGKEAFKGAKNLKTITIKGNVTSIGKNAFSGINSKATFKIKATKTNYNKIVSRIKKSGVAKTVKFQRIK